MSLSKEKIEWTTSPHVTQGVAIERFEQFSSNKNNFLSVKKSQFNNTNRPFLSTIELHTNQKSVILF